MSETNEKRKVLVVDDEVENLNLLKRVLRRNYDVIQAESGLDALEMLKENDFYMILSDQKMPKMTGTEFLAKSIESHPAALRILITGYSDIESVIDAINEGSVHRYIKKPWGKDELLDEIQRTIETQRLIVQNQRLVTELKDTNKNLKEKEQLLLQDLDSRSKEIYEANEALKLLNEQLKSQSLKDGLTGLYNHKAFQERLKEECNRAVRNGRPLSLIFFDVDNFKHYNDTHGHSAGDEVLVQIGQLLTQATGNFEFQVRTSDVVARYGGEEFAIILPETPYEGAIIKAEKVRKSIEAHPFPHAAEQPLGSVSVSVGVSNLSADTTEAEELIEFADQAMYHSKEAGRNRVTAYKILAEQETVN